MFMDKIKLIRVNSKTTGFKIFQGLVISFEECEKIIVEQMESGYEYKGFVPVEQRGRGEFTKIDLIFQKN